VAFNGHVERCAYLSHAIVAEPSQSLHEDRDGHALDGVEVDRGSAGDWIIGGLQDDLAGQAADGGRARCDERASQSRDGRIA
jgi:hypothetical protein